MKGKFNLLSKLVSIPKDDLYISEITLAELKFGVENSENSQKNRRVLDNFLSGVQILPIINSLDIYAQEKTRLRRDGEPIDDFDLLIGATAIFHDMILVTNNVRHFQRLKNITIENWTEK